MKLKKIVSLALAGILAVSMLAGCGNNDKEEGGASSNTTPTVTTFTSTIYGKLGDTTASIMDTKSDSYLADAFAVALKNVPANQQNTIIELANGAIANQGADTTINGVLDFIDGALSDKYTVYGAEAALTADDIGTNEDRKYVQLYKYSNGLNDEQIASNIAAAIDGLMEDKPTQANSTTIDYYLTVEKAEVGVAGNGAVVVAVMIEVDVTKN